jgi:uncharacterized protein (UPF0332 family)
MIREDYATEIQANIERAEKAVEASETLASEGYFDFAASRAYYAAFYASTALLLNEGIEFRKHSGVITAIHQHFIKTGLLEKQLGQDLNWLFELRSIGDYGVMLHVPKEKAKQAILAARNFVQAIQIQIGSRKKDPP